MGFPWTEQVTQGMTIAAAGIHTAAQTAATYLTSAVDMVKFRKVVFVIDLGVLGSSATVDFQITAATTSGGAYTAVAGTAITQVLQASSGSSKYAFVEISADFLESTQGYGYRYIKGSLIVGVATSQVAVIVFGACAGSSEPTSGFADASLVQTVVLGA